MKKSRKSHTDSGSESDGKDTVDWINGLNYIQQIYITQKYKRNNGYGSDNDVIHMNPDEINYLKEKCKKKEKKLKQRWEVYTTQRARPKRKKVAKELSIGKNNWRYTGLCVMVKDSRTGKGRILHALLDSGCTKSIILKSLHCPKRKLD